MLSDRAGGVGRVEFHAEPEVHLPERQQRAEGHGDGAGLLRRVHAAVDDPRQLAGGELRVERISGHGHEHAAQFRHGISVRHLRRLPRQHGHQRGGKKEGRAEINMKRACFRMETGSFLLFRTFRCCGRSRRS